MLLPLLLLLLDLHCWPPPSELLAYLVHIGGDHRGLGLWLVSAPRCQCEASLSDPEVSSRQCQQGGMKTMGTTW